MPTPDLPSEISKQDFDLATFVRLALIDDHARDEIVAHMLHNDEIMVYYHCFYVLDRASQEQPDLFYRYWDEFAALLRHPNSYHRDFGLTLLANLSAIDREDRMAEILPEYLEHSHDDKFMTALCCIRSTAKILRCKPELRRPVLDALLNVDRTSSYPEKQQALLKYDILAILEEIYPQEQDQDRMATFIRAEATSPSPKTRKKAKELISKFGL